MVSVSIATDWYTGIYRADRRDAGGWSWEGPQGLDRIDTKNLPPKAERGQRQACSMGRENTIEVPILQLLRERAWRPLSGIEAGRSRASKDAT